MQAPHTPEGWADMTAVVKEAAALWQAWIDQDQAQGRAEVSAGWRRLSCQLCGAGCRSTWGATCGRTAGIRWLPPTEMCMFDQHTPTPNRWRATHHL